ncbi:MAG TPA: PA2779 family protein [Syntrophorhabdales bacterium]|nr:PA2779 family protein [Syntrophorhabdales bacterium]
MVKRALVCYLAMALLIIGMVPRVEAAFSPSEAFILGPSVRVTDLENIQTALENKLIRQRLHDLGYSTEEITSRLAQLTDQQVHAIAQKLDDLRVGGDGVEIAILAIVCVILVIAILYFTGHKLTVR